MKLGLNVPNFGPDTEPESLAAWVRFADGAGFDLAMMSDHVAITPDVAAIYPPPFFEPFTTLAWLAGITERVGLGTSVTVLPYRHPVLTARVAATVDRFSDGRFILGVGAGWSEQEYAALGVPFRRRGAITDDYLAAIKQQWSDEVASHDGEFATFRDVHTAPVRRPHPPIWVGGSSRAAVRRAVAFGDAWHPINAEPSWLGSAGLDALRSAAAAAERPVPDLCPRIRLHLAVDTAAGDGRRAGEGDLSQVLRDVEEFAALGARYLVLDTNPDHPSQRRPAVDDWRALEAVAEQARKLGLAELE